MSLQKPSCSILCSSAVFFRMSHKSVLAELHHLSRLVELSQPSLACSSDDMSELVRCMQGTNNFLHHQAKALLQRASGRSCLVWYSNDTTPMMTRQCVRNSIGQLRFVQRVRSTGEFVIQRLFIEDSHGNRAVLLSEPHRVADKTATTHFAVFR